MHLFLDYFALGILCVIVISLIAIIVYLGVLPGKIARKRGHPQVDAINVCSWLGLITGGITWLIALVWAFMTPGQMNLTDNSQINALQQRVLTLEERVKQLEEGE